MKIIEYRCDNCGKRDEETDGEIYDTVSEVHERAKMWNRPECCGVAMNSKLPTCRVKGL